MKIDVVGVNAWSLTDDRTAEVKTGISVFCVFDDMGISRGRKAEKFSVVGGRLEDFSAIPGTYEADFSPKGKLMSARLIEQ